MTAINPLVKTDLVGLFQSAPSGYIVNDDLTLELPYAFWESGPCSSYLLLLEAGYLHVSAGWLWDGPSGPAVDTPALMLASLVHDALYALHGPDCGFTYADADQFYRDVAIAQGAWKLRAWAHWLGLRLGGWAHRWRLSAASKL